MSRKNWMPDWDQMSDSDLESAARYYLWLGKSFPEMQIQRLDEIVAEASRRGKPEIVEYARATVHTRRANG